VSTGSLLDAGGALGLGVALWVPYTIRVRAGRRRRLRGPSRAARAAYACGAAVVVAALWPLVDEAAAERFSWHMAQHLALMMAAAPLLAAGRPELAWRPLVPGRWRAKIPALTSLRARRLLVAGLVISTAVLWAWHLPAAFEAALRSEPVHILEHLSMLVAGVAFWWPILSPAVRRAAGEGAALGCLIAGGLQSSALGALMVFATAPWYPSYRAVALAHGLSPLADQQVAGLLMWIPPSVIQLGVAAWLFLRWLAREDEAAATGVPPLRLRPDGAGYSPVPGRTSR
jgi:cytochrome c oxidase assembly factor CtaG